MTTARFNKSYFLNPARARYGVTDALKRVVAALPPEARVLELGCGDLQVLRALRGIRDDLKCVGVDCGTIPESAASDSIEFIHSRIEDFRAEPTFDLVLGIDVLEHLTQPDELVRVAHAALRPGGRLYVSAPCTTKLLLLGDANFFSDYSHVRPFNPKSMRRLLADGGFSVEDVRLYGARQGGLLKWFYYLARGLLTANAGYINAAIIWLGGHAVEAVATKS